MSLKTVMGKRASLQSSASENVEKPFEHEPAAPLILRRADFLLFLFLAEEERDKVIQTLDKQFLGWINRYGRRFANLIYLTQVCRAVMPNLIKQWPRIRTLVWLSEILRRFF